MSGAAAVVDLPASARTGPGLPPVPVQRWGALVADCRHRRGLSQRALAERCGVRQQAISKVEAGELVPTDRLKIRIAYVLLVDVADLFPWPKTR